MIQLLLALVLVQPAPPATEVAPFALTEPPTIIWADADAALHAGLTLEGLAVQPLIGEVLEANNTLVLERGRLVLLSGEQLVTLAGPGTWRLVPGALETAFGRRPTAEAAAPYREGPLPIIEPDTSMPDRTFTLGATLALVEPRSPVMRTSPRSLRWRWPYEGGRFDLTVTRTDNGSDTVVERWRNIEGRAHTLWTELVPGATYRVVIALSSETEDSAIADAHTFRVADVAEAQALDASLAAFDARLRSATEYQPELDVLKARLCESHGLWAESEALWTGLAILHPERPELLYHALRLHRRTMGDG